MTRNLVQVSLSANLASLSAGEVLVTGSTSSTDFPITKGAYQTTIPPSPLSIFAATSRFISRLNAGGSALVYSTFFASLPNDNGSGIEVDDQGAAYVTGDTFGSFPATAGAFTGPVEGIVNAAPCTR